MVKERVFYPILITLLIIGIAGVPIIGKALYAAPIIGIIVMLASGVISFNLSRPVLPFVMLLVVMMFNAYSIDYSWAKKLYFVLAYTSIFLIFDFSKIQPDIRKLSGLFIAVFLIQKISDGTLFLFSAEDVSLIDSRSILESTLAFPLGMFAIYFLYARNYLWFCLNLCVAVLAFKRVVLLGLLICVVMYFIPKKMRGLFLNAYVVTFAIFVLVIMQIQLAMGAYNEIIASTFGVSVDQLLMGRQQLWSGALEYLQFDYLKFSFWGAGHNGLEGYLAYGLPSKELLLHSDFLLLFLEYGMLFLILFSFLLQNQASPCRKALALYLALLFSSDNVLIYQHVMIPYLLLMTVSRKQPREINVKPTVHRGGDDELIPPEIPRGSVPHP